MTQAKVYGWLHSAHKQDDSSTTIHARTGWGQTYWFFPNNQLFHLLDLGDMIFISPELTFTDPLIDPY